jgi:hypothetical protein
MKKALIAIFAAVMLVAFVAPAMAKTYVGGIVFQDFYYYSQNDEDASGGVVTGAQPTTQGFGHTDLDTMGGTRLKARWTNEDNVGMYIEFGMGGASGANAVNLRHAYGWWDINPAVKLLAGHTTLPYAPLVPQTFLGLNSPGGHIIGLGFGEWDSSRVPQVRMEFAYPNDMGRLNVCLVSPFIRAYPAGLFPADADPVAQNTVVEDTKLPMFVAGSPLYFGNLRLYPSFFVQQKTLDQAAAGKPDEATSYGLALDGRYTFGPFDFSGSFHYGQNYGLAAGSVAGPPAKGPAATTTAPLGWNIDGVAGIDVIEDTTTYGWWVSLQMKLGPSTPALTVGQLHSENDGIAQVANSDFDADSMMIGISWPIDLAKGFRLRPEGFYYDNGDSNTLSGRAAATDEVDNGNHWILGLQFQITF